MPTVLSATLDSVALDHIHYEQLDATSWCATATVNTTLMAPAILWYGLSSRLAPYLNHSPTLVATDIGQLHWEKVEQQQPLSVLDVAHHKRQQQRKGVRLLLEHLLSNLDITDSLDDSEFPYRLNNTDHYICFSHSDDHSQRFSKRSSYEQSFQYTLKSKVAVALSFNRAIGIDIETQLIAWPTVQRYYHANELTLLLAMPKSQRDAIAKSLWQLKESFIKINNSKLAQGLGIDYSRIIPMLNDSYHTESNKLTVMDINGIFNNDADKKSEYQIALLSKQQTLIIF